MKSPLLCLQENMATLSPTEKAVASQILEKPELVSELCIHDLAKETFSSSSELLKSKTGMKSPPYYPHNFSYSLA